MFKMYLRYFYIYLTTPNVRLTRKMFYEWVLEQIRELKNTVIRVDGTWICRNSSDFLISNITRKIMVQIINSENRNEPCFSLGRNLILKFRKDYF